MHLLATLGSTFAVVPEAYLMGNGEERYTHVTVLATSGIGDSVAEVRRWFGEHAAEVKLHIVTIAGLPDIRDIDDHGRYEEALFRVHFHCTRIAGGIQNLHLCLAGGFKTISSAAHQTADLLGCGKLFHLTSPFGERFDTDESIRQGIEEKKINLIDLGPRPGWPTIQSLADEAEPLPPDCELLEISSISLREKILTRLREANLLAQSQHELATLPFPVLATWPPSHRHWLDQPLDPHSPADQAWVRALPKVELHCHLGGFATHGDLLHRVRAAAGDPAALPPLPIPGSSEDITTTPPADWPLPAGPIGLEPYRQLGDLNGSALLRDPGCLTKQIELLYHHLQQENVHYAEIRCSPANYTSPGRSPWDVLTDIIKTVHHVAKNSPLPPTRINLIIIATRQPGGDYRSQLIRHLMLAVTAAEHFTMGSICQVVGVDLAGFEDPTTRAHYFRDDFLPVHRSGLSLTVHAGENDDAEAIWSAIFDLSTMRLGHGLSLYESPSLLTSVARRRIAVEMCPYANFQIKGYPLDQDAKVAPENDRYPLLRYLRANVPVTINTDNIGISAATLSDNFLLAARLCPGLTRLDVLRLLANAAHATFSNVQERQSLFEALQQHLPQPPAPR